MSRHLMDFLADSYLLNPDHIESRYRLFSDAELRAELDAYLAHASKTAPERLTELADAGRDSLCTWLDMSGDQLTASVSVLRRACLYFDVVYCAEPILALCEEPHILEESVNRLLGFDGRGIPRLRLAEGAAYVRRLQPLIAAGCLKLVAPPSRTSTDTAIMKVGGGKISGVFPGLARGRLPDILTAELRVEPLMRTQSGWMSGPDVPAGPGRAISLSHPGHDSRRIYTLLRDQIDSWDSDTGKVVLNRDYPEDLPPSELEYESWIQDAKRSYAGDILRRLAHEVGGAQATSSIITTESTLVAGLLSEAPPAQRRTRELVAELALRIDVPVLERLSLSQVAHLRGEGSESFVAYRTALQRQLRGLRGVTDPAVLSAKLDDVAHEFEECQLPEMVEDLRRMRKKYALEIPVSIIGLVTGFAWSPVGALLATLGVLKAASAPITDRRNIRAKPAYFLWRARSMRNLPD